MYLNAKLNLFLGMGDVQCVSGQNLLGVRWGPHAQRTLCVHVEAGGRTARMAKGHIGVLWGNCRGSPTWSGVQGPPCKGCLTIPPCSRWRAREPGWCPFADDPEMGGGGRGLLAAFSLYCWCSALLPSPQAMSIFAGRLMTREGPSVETDTCLPSPKGALALRARPGVSLCPEEDPAWSRSRRLTLEGLWGCWAHPSVCLKRWGLFPSRLGWFHACL